MPILLIAAEPERASSWYRASCHLLDQNLRLEGVSPNCCHHHFSGEKTEALRGEVAGSPMTSRRMGLRFASGLAQSSKLELS